MIYEDIRTLTHPEERSTVFRCHGDILCPHDKTYLIEAPSFVGYDNGNPMKSSTVSEGLELGLVFGVLVQYY